MPKDLLVAAWRYVCIYAGDPAGGEAGAAAGTGAGAAVEPACCGGVPTGVSDSVSLASAAA